MKDLILFLSALIWLLSADPGPGALPQWTGSYPIGAHGIANDKDTAAHDFHGIGHSIEDKTGLYFKRKGQRCRLYTKAFLEKYER